MSNSISLIARRVLTPVVIGTACALTACSSDVTVSGPGYRCDVSNPVADVFLTPTSSVVYVHSPARATDTTHVTATATNRAGGTRTDVPISLTSSDASVATVDSSGIVHALQPGTITITAKTCGKSATATVTVTLITNTVKIAADTNSVVAGDSVVLSASAIDVNGATIPGAKFTFSSAPATGIAFTKLSDSTVKAKFSASGTYTITAAGEGASGSTTVQVAPRVFIAGNAAALDVGTDFGCALISLGRMYCWGANEFSQLGTVTDSTCFDETGAITKPCSLMPLRVEPTLTFTSVSAGNGFACGITTTGATYCWGNGDFGKLGNGLTAGSGVPALVSSALQFRTVSTGGNHACGILKDDVTPAYGRTYCWGSDAFDQLGDDRLVNSTTPVPVADGSGGAALYSAVTTGWNHTCALTADGIAHCWGANSDGQLGLGTYDASNARGVLGQKKFISIAAGGDVFGSHTCAIATDGTAYCWGSNAYGQLGIDTSVPKIDTLVAVGTSVKFTKIVTGAYHTCALTSAGAVYCWGLNTDLQLGRGPATGGGTYSSTPQLVAGGQLPSGVTFSTLSAGARHTCATGSDGNVYCWGSNVFGALGNTLQAAFRGYPQQVMKP